jgi:septal ring factor EnvC (AmiA/AmiB activator)
MRRAWRLGLVLAVVPALLAPAVLAQVPKRESAEIGDKQQDLQQTQKRLLEERQKAADARKREAGVLSELEGIDRRLSDKRQQVVALDTRLRRAQADVGELQGEIGRLQSRRSGQEDVLGRRLRALY